MENLGKERGPIMADDHEDCEHRVGDPPTDVNLRPNCRMSFNAYYFPQLKRKT